MSKNVLSISTQLVKDRTVANDNIDDALIVTSIKYAQDVYIHPILGTSFYDALLTKIETDVALTADETVLVDRYIIDCLLYYTLSELPLTLGYKFHNKNVLSKGSEGSQTPSMPELLDLAQWYRNKAEYYEQRAIRYLLESESTNKYPLYTNYGNGVDAIRPKKSGYSTSIYLGDDSECCDKRPFEKYYQGNNFYDL